ncbi:MAG: hypothetical protein WAK31_21990 [Chthoniobacterales bacterium]
MKKLIVTAAAILSLVLPVRAADMETYGPDNPSGTKTGYMVSKVDGKRRRITIANFGIEDAQPGRQFGQYLASAGYNSGQAEAESWQEAWHRYPDDRFFPRCFAQEAKNAYMQATEKIPRISTLEEYNQLTPGALFRWSEGKLYRAHVKPARTTASPAANP